ncbi:MAG: ABC transporter substrate-binding protein, partial [Actinobacteria bacterium]|nr:ABC transporter substrate-binding protein [Actinomycetota bacterium]
MIMKKILILLVTVVLIVSLGVGCKAATTATTAAAETTKAAETTAAATVPQYDKLVVGTLPLGMGVVVQWALEKGYFKELGLNIEKSMFGNGALLNEAVNAKLIDVAVSGTASVFSLANSAGILVGETGIAGKIGLYARPDSKVLTKKGEIPEHPDMYGSKDTIKGLNFLGPLGTSCQLETIKYVNLFGLNMSDVKMTGMDVGQAFQAYVAGQGDLLPTWSPFGWQAVDKGYVLVAPFEEITGFYSTDSIFVRPEVLKERRDEIVLFLKAIYHACDDLQDNDLRIPFAIKFFGDNGIVWTEDYMTREANYCFYFTKDYISKPEYLFGKSNLAFGEFFTEAGQITKDNLPNITKSFDTSIIKDALGIDVKVAE